MYYQYYYDPYLSISAKKVKTWGEADEEKERISTELEGAAAAILRLLEQYNLNFGPDYPRRVTLVSKQVPEDPFVLLHQAAATAIQILNLARWSPEQKIMIEGQILRAIGNLTNLIERYNLQSTLADSFRTETTEIALPEDPASLVKTALDNALSKVSRGYPFEGY